MKGFLSKIAVFFLSILVLFSSSFAIVDTHFCCGDVIDSSIFGKADACEMAMASCRLENTSASREKENCCYNSTVYKSRDFFIKHSPINVDLQQFKFVPNFYLPTTNLFIESEVNISYYKDYKSPLMTKDILVLVQRFLI